MALKISKRVYSPIHRISTNLQKTVQKTINDDLEYILYTTDYISGKNRILNEIINKNRPTLEETLIKDILHGTNAVSIDERIKEYNLAWLNNTISLLLITETDKIDILLSFDIIENGYKGVYTHYNSLIDLMSSSVGIIKQPILTPSDLPTDNNDTIFYPLDLGKNLIINVVKNNRNAAMGIVDKIISRNLANNVLEKDAQNNFILLITTTFNRILQNLCLTPDEIFGKDCVILLELKMCKTPVLLREKIYELFEILLNVVDEQAKNKNNILIDKIIEYIHNNYMCDISLNDLGDEFKLSPGYISQLFKNISGENFKNFISIYRINMSKEILKKNKNIRIKDLANIVGFNNPNTFIRTFNKYEGKSPGAVCQIYIR